MAGVKYADYALGRLIEEARKKPWFDDTLIVIVADHCAASAGRTELPVKRYEIPLLVYAPGHVKPGRVDTMMSQIDIAPTVLGLLDVRYATRFMGRDILRDASRQRAFISTYQKLGYIQDNTLVVLSPRKYIMTYFFDRRSGAAKGTASREEAVGRAIAYFQGASFFTARHANRLATVVAFR